MAAKFQFEIWTGEPLSGGSAADTISLLSYTDDFELAASGYMQDVAADESTPIIERIKLRVKESSHDNLAASLQDLAAYIRAAKFTQTSTVPVYTVWLRVKLTNETGDRVAYVYDIQVQQSDKFNQTTLAKNAIVEYNLIVKRAPLWERDVNARNMTDAVDTYDVTDVTAKFDLTVYGDAPARMRNLEFGVPAAAAIPVDELWWGWISEGNYPASNVGGGGGIFLPTWKMDSASVFDTDTSAQVVAGSISTNVAQCDFGTVTAMLPRVKISLYDKYASNNFSGMGKFLVLCRCGLSGAGEVHLRLGVGAVNSVYNSTDKFAKRGRVAVTNTGWYIYELGVVQFPIQGFLSTAEGVGQEGVQIEAELISGSINLNIDALYFLPIAEGWGHVTGLTDVDGDAWGIEIGETYHTGIYANNATAGGNYSPSVPVVQMGGGVPVGSSGVALVVIGQRAASSVSTDTIDIDYLYVKDRYRDLRGAV